MCNFQQVCTLKEKGEIVQVIYSSNWHNKLKIALVNKCYVESTSDPCIFISKDMIVLIYVDCCTLIFTDKHSIKNFVRPLETGTKNFVFTLERTLNSCLDVSISELFDGKKL